jgi:ferredoxin
VKISIDYDACQGHGRCYEIAPEIFVDDEAGLGVVIDPEVDPALLDRARAAVNACPEGAISMRD